MQSMSAMNGPGVATKLFDELILSRFERENSRV